MSDQPVFSHPGAANSAAYWQTWRETAAPRSCEGCGASYQPHHPRARYCGPECPERPRARRTVRRGVRTRPPRAAQRAKAVQGLMADVLVAITALHHSGEASRDTGRPLVAAVKRYAEAEGRGDHTEARVQAIRATALLCTRVLDRAGR